MESTRSNRPPSYLPLKRAIRRYWDSHLHDEEVVSSPVGSPGFFEELERYRFGKLPYLSDLIDFQSYEGMEVLEVGCGAGIDLARFARSGAQVFGVDLSVEAIKLARRNFELQGLVGSFGVVDGEGMPFKAGSFDAVYSHGVVPYTADAERMVSEMHRVLRPGGTAVSMAYNRRSWLNWLSTLTKTPPQHREAPVYRMHTKSEFGELFKPFDDVRILLERYPVPTKLHSGWKAILYDRLFVNVFNALPKRLVKPYGWHLIAFAQKK